MARCYLSLYCPEISAARLAQLVEWCERYSPLVAQDGSNGAILDITGCTHLFGGEGQLLLDIQQRLYRLGIESHGAISDVWGVAWALARYGSRFIVHGEKDAIEALELLPVEALRLPGEIVAELRRLGLTTIAAVRKIPRRSLAARFGSTLIWRLDHAFRNAQEPLTPWRPPAQYRASRILAEPVSTVNAVAFVLQELLKEICGRLDKNHLGSRQIELACYRVDGTVDRCEVRTSKPTRSIHHLQRLFDERLEKLKAQFGFETFALSVLEGEALYPKQRSFSQLEQEEDESSFDALVDRFGMRLGFEEVNRIRVCESLLPENAIEFRPATATLKESAAWPEHRLRPIRLISPPIRIEVSIIIPGESPVMFFIGQRKHSIVRSEGPERLTPEWWREKGQRVGTRDYYRIEDETGSRFWIFREEAGSWFLHGHLP